MKPSQTVLGLLNSATECLRRAGIEDARLNAELLLGKVVGVQRAALYARFEQEVSESACQEFRELLNRRAAREPLQYLVGSCEFCGREFEVSPVVMIPRQDTELVVEKCIEKVPEEEFWAADVCTGSGAIAVTLAVERPSLRVAATDSSPKALEVAERNAKRHGVEERVLLGHGELAEPVKELLPAGREHVGLVVSNPPYVPTARIEELQPEVRDHEPRCALDGGPDGLAVVRRLVPQAASLLSPGGWLVVEIGEGQADGVRAIVKDAGVFAEATIQTVVDAAGCERAFCVRKAAG